MKIRLFGCSPESIVDGKGLRYSIFVQGCNLDCPDCHNPESHDPQGGYEEDTEKLLGEIFENPLLDGVTFSGGEPFLQTQPLIEIGKAVKAKGLNIWIYSGFTFDELIVSEDKKIRELLSLADVLVDGPFSKEERSLELAFKGSKNQRLINVGESLKNNKIILFEV